MRMICFLCGLILYLPVWCVASPVVSKEADDGLADRKIWLSTMTRIAEPVLVNVAEGTLKKNMPYESLGKRHEFAYLEAFGRTICGIAPWLELGYENTEEGKLRQRYVDLAIKGIQNAVNPASSDYMIFNKPSQPLVDAAFLAQGLLRAPNNLWGKLSEETRKQVVGELKRCRAIKPFESNWLLFASMIEAALLEFTGEYDIERLLYGVEKFRDHWYEGDAQYGDGPKFHEDYYNSFVIHPMLTDVLRVMEKNGVKGAEFCEIQQKRLKRYAGQLERHISPEGTYPVVGRSIVYRTGVFHALGQAALLNLLPKSVQPAQVRCALTAVIKQQFASPENFDDQGWLRIGFNGRQLKMSESYINTGSLYLCLTGFLPLGISLDDPFWSEPYTDWTCRKAWSGQDVEADHALRD